jgi:hypothetical protein
MRYSPPILFKFLLLLSLLGITSARPPLQIHTEDSNPADLSELFFDSLTPLAAPESVDLAKNSSVEFLTDAMADSS